MEPPTKEEIPRPMPIPIKPKPWEPEYAYLRPRAYYVNWCPWNGRDEEVHVAGCKYLARADRRYVVRLGYFFDCKPAVEYAKTVLPKADGCAFCCPLCDHDVHFYEWV